MTHSVKATGVPNDPYPFWPTPLKPLHGLDGVPDLVARLKHAVLTPAFEGGKQPQVLGKDDEGFSSAATIFNGAVKTPALALVKPVNAMDVSRTIKFCKQHSIEVSVKGGGNGVHGWSVAGHVILDLSELNDISISLPSPYPPTLQESFEKLRVSSATPPEVLDRPAIAQPAKSSTKRHAVDGVEDGTDADGSRGKKKTGSGLGISYPATDALPISNATAGPSTTPRITYVNPSQTPTSSFPFLPTTVGDSSSSTLFNAQSGYTPSYLNLLPQHALFNTNANPPPFTLVTFGAGVRSKQLDDYTGASPYGAFHVPTSAFPVGSGQFLSGGFGFLSRKHGLGMDNLVEVEMVLADGRIVWLGDGGAKGGDWKDDEDPEEVWWAVRGAGPVVGVVTRFRAKAYYTPSVYAGILIYVFDENTTPSLLRHVRDCIKSATPSLYANIILTAGPPGAPAIVVFQLCFSGKNARQEGENYVQAISSWEGGKSLFSDFSERTFGKQQLAVEDVLKGGYGRKWFIKSDLLLSLTDEVIDETCARFHSVPDGCRSAWLFEYTGSNALASPPHTKPRSCFPESHRSAAFTVAALHQWAHDESPEDDARCVLTAEEWIEDVIHPNSPGGPLPCFLQSQEEHRVVGVYGVENYERLKRLKKQLDPDNMFKHAMWPVETKS
ncbi:hypothetical protein B9479_000794 [Cryptococcus floricola]|uniref:FAD-binding PCMH-type domain-containing protein n=1 Tax=Cryptococcus floricola TaxID=2591691 RepID=A0A5D3B6Z4_9TREE|nr:hypothetical protein B9479_000794 [Cryptococcus floricola]